MPDLVNELLTKGSRLDGGENSASLGCLFWSLILIGLGIVIYIIATLPSGI